MGPEDDVLHESDLGRMADPTLDLADGPAPTTLPSPAPRRYVVLERLGEGGMGVVYIAYDTRLDRRVALKVLRKEESPLARARFMREAQALAKLHHPNVVTLFDAGAVGERPYLAMELVDGTSLREWLVRKPRAWREVVRVFLLAGRGLAAAHAAGLVHRDVKPDNILVARDGSARMADFGLVRAVGGSEPVPPAPEEPVSDLSTRTNALLGTPRYMAPEPKADERSDQYSFCVSLAEALDGRDPPQSVRRVVARGSSAEPANRFPSMNDLLAALDPEPRRRRRRMLLIGLGLVALTAGAFAIRPAADPAQLCAGAASQLDGAWDQGVRARLRAAFLATGRPYAADVLATVERTLDGYARGWSAEHRQACEATHVRAEQSPELLDLRMACLVRRRNELAAVTSLLAQRPDVQLLDRAPSVADSVTPVSGCADARALRAAVPPPDRPELAGRVAALRTRIHTASALAIGGKVPEALPMAADTTVLASQVPYPALWAEALYQLGDVQDRSGLHAIALDTLTQAGVAAARAGDDATLARSWISRYFVLASEENRAAEAATFLPAVEAALLRAGNDRAQRARLSAYRGLATNVKDRYDEARGYVDEARRIYIELHGPDSRDVAVMTSYLGVIEYRAAKLDAARALYDRALLIDERIYGPQHPLVALDLSNVALITNAQGHRAETLGLRRRALAIVEGTPGPPTRDLAVRLGNVALTLLDDHRPDEARPLFERARDVLLRVGGPDAPYLAVTHVELGRTLAELGEGEAARRAAEEGLRVARKVFGPENEKTAEVQGTFALVVWTSDRKAGVAEYQRALAIAEKAYRSDHPRLGVALADLAFALIDTGAAARAAPLLVRALAIAEKDDPRGLLVDRVLLGQGLVQLRSGRRDGARPLIERALAMREQRELDPVAIGEARFALAQTLWATPAERARARGLASDAAGLYATRPRGTEAQAQEIREWLAAR